VTAGPGLPGPGEPADWPGSDWAGSDWAGSDWAGSDWAGAARAWVADDPDPVTRAELLALVAVGDAAGAVAALRERLDGRLAFGTAGLRGPVRAGPTGMNSAVVRRAAAGLAAVLGPGRSVVVGRDARHGSATFAMDTARVLTGAGLRALLLPRPLPTPVTAFIARRLGADAAVMVTASHNPAADNGYKVYLPDAQIVPPADAEIEAAMLAAGPVAALPLGDPGEALGEDAVAAYVEAVVGCSLVPHRGLRMAYTPLHGVGAAVWLDVLARAGFPPPAVVAAQAEPDPDFPTVAFPNPEEPGAMDAVLALGSATGAQLVLAHDPDADRLAAAEDGRVFTGDELGALLADHVLAHAAPGVLVATTVVSSRLLGRLAAARGATYAETLTGFKWLVRAGDAGGPELVFAYEEALGYAVAPGLVRDKDGISAGLLLAERSAELRAAGSSLAARLDELARELGLHVTAQVSVRLASPAAGAAAVDAFRADPPGPLVDLALGAGGLPPTDGVVLTLASAADGGPVRVVVRPSGTEPKLKLYLEAVRESGDDLAGQRAAVRADLLAVAAALLDR